jgi:chemotaxis protein methyltransferase WspC
MQHIESLLRKEIGLDAASIGSSLIERIIRLRMKQHGLKHLDAYQHLLDTSPDELRELIEAVVVTETWFFRDREPFNAFVQLVQTEWLPRHPVGPFRVLSVPCSSGEEPYSLAMALLDAGVPDTRFRIDAADISANALTRAARAIYGKNSFRGRDLAFRNRHFQHTKEGFLLSPSVRATVSFRRENILDKGFLSGSAPYDFILCRNLLIYFDRATQGLVREKLHRLLADDGALFVGPAEMPLVCEAGFVSANFPLAFACRKSSGNSVPAGRLRRRKSPTPGMANGVPAAGKAHGSRFDTDNAALQPSPVHLTTTAPDSLEAARLLADTGQLTEAAAICESYLASHGPSAEAYYLLGLMKDAADDPEAITYYRKALYLEPNHYEALVHIALWLEKNGDLPGARPFKRRAARAQTAK